MQAQAAIVQAKMKPSDATLVRGTSMFLPRKGPTSVRTAITMLPVLGAPDFGSISAKDVGSISLRPMASIRRVEAPKKEFMGPRGPSVAMMSIAT